MKKHLALVVLMLVATLLVGACIVAPATPTPERVIVVVTATPKPQQPAAPSAKQSDGGADRGLLDRIADRWGFNFESQERRGEGDCPADYCIIYFDPMGWSFLQVFMVDGEVDGWGIAVLTDAPDEAANRNAGFSVDIAIVAGVTDGEFDCLLDAEFGEEALCGHWWTMSEPTSDGDGFMVTFAKAN